MKIREPDVRSVDLVGAFERRLSWTLRTDRNLRADRQSCRCSTKSWAIRLVGTLAGFTREMGLARVISGKPVRTTTSDKAAPYREMPLLGGWRRPRGCGPPRLSTADYEPALSKSLAFSAIIITGTFGFPPIWLGMTDASTMRRPSMPWTRRSASTTALPGSRPIRQVPTAC